MQIRVRVSILAIIFASCFSSLPAQRAANADATYQQLRSLLPGSEVITVSNFELKREAATFTFKTGSFAFFDAVNGKVTGAVFKGDGHLHLTPPTTEERRNLKTLNQSDEFDEDFDQATLRFTDASSAELRSASGGAGQPDPSYAKVAQEWRDYQRKKLQDNIDLRILEDVLSPAPGGYFLAEIRGKKNGHLFFTIDPHGAPEVEPEEVSLMSLNDWGPVFLTAFRLSSAAGGGGAPNEDVKVPNEDLDVSIDKGGFLTGLATVHLIAQQDGVAVVPLDLYPTLRVSNVEAEGGGALNWVQEKKDEDSDFAVILAKPLRKGESAVVRVAYGGKDVVKNEGGSNYYPIARESWYPNAARSLGDYAIYHMLFHVPKGLQLIATGTKVSEGTEGKITTTEWKTDVPLPVVGFNLGDFTMKEATVPNKLGDNLTIDAYANKNPPDEFYAVAQAATDTPSGGAGNAPEGAIGSINTASMLPVQLSQGEVAAQIYTNYFGPIPFAKVAITQQFACNYGQSWPMLVYLPICGFLDSTQQHVLGLHPEDMYWKMVTPHEVSHQWWGQTVGFRSYRDQWMSEGFADESASIFLLLTRPKPNDYLDFWKEERKLITEKNSMGLRPIDVGPVTMGFRLSSEKTGFSVYRDLVYPKGAFILHMIQMMMWSPQGGDKVFMETMHDFVTTYHLKAATTEDFKAMVEKHMTPGMDLDHNHTMDWFFNEYVYGTDLPGYHFDGEATPNGDGWNVHFKLTQSGVAPNFVNAVPFYLELTDGRILRPGSLIIRGSKTEEQTVSLPKLPAPIKKVMINYYYDVLSTDN